MAYTTGFMVLKNFRHDSKLDFPFTKPNTRVLTYKPRAQNTGCPRRNVKYFGRVFLMLNYTDITQNTYIQS